MKSLGNVRLAECPTGGKGVHRWLYHAACTLAEAGFSNADAKEIIEERMTRDPNPADEIESALAAARREDKPETRRWPARDIGLIKSIRDTPMPILPPVTLDTEAAIDLLFPGDPLLCVGPNSFQFRTLPRAKWRGNLHRMSLLVPSPMNARWGTTKAGKQSQHSLDNTGYRRFLVTEFDWGDRETQVKLIFHLAKHAPLCCMVSSGGKSIHGWFRTWDIDETRDSGAEVIEGFMSYAISVGADPVTYLRSQFVRVPGGLRDGKTPQPILYFNESNLQP